MRKTRTRTNENKLSPDVQSKTVQSATDRPLSIESVVKLSENTIIFIFMNASFPNVAFEIFICIVKK